ncbi:MAG: heparan-alpha-glucosaminide N-acetyltransferase domain-containing protein [Isosphaeraceae bacterium]|nr:heparan-alpha-glucosaminide N-acetyltransferase domain-containing protein [Isosphaeraceae bacterium]
MASALTAQPVAESAFPRAERPRPRLDSIDLLRGVALVVMVLDHVRDYFARAQFSPSDLEQTTPALFFTRWATHSCAPVFVFLAGTAVYLSSRRGKSCAELSRFLVVRGIWLIFLELTILRFGMCFSFDYHWVSLTVLWAIGWSMVALAALIWLPTPIVGAIGLAVVAGHNLLDSVAIEHPAWLKALWAVLHGPPETFHTRAGLRAHVMYPLLPWVGVMAAGYAFGLLIEMDRARRQRLFLGIGLGMVTAFFALRSLNVYGDPEPWVHQKTPLFTFLSFLNVEKYPPSLDFVLITLGPAIALLTYLDRDWEPGGVDTWLITFGRVPLFFFLLHWQLVHLLAVIVGVGRGEDVGWMFKVPPFDAPDGYGFSLPVVYLVWGAVILGAYPVCRWFALLKERRRDIWWLSYF